MDKNKHFGKLNEIEHFSLFAAILISATALIAVLSLAINGGTKNIGFAAF